MTTGKTQDEIKKEVEQLMREIEMREKQARAQGRAFSAPSRAQIAKKIKGETSKSPFITDQAWDPRISPGTSTYYRISVYNPDPDEYWPVYASIFFGVANFLNNDDLGQALANGNFNNDIRWPYMSSSEFGLAPGATESQTFNYVVQNVPLTTYIGNCVIWRGELHDRGQYFDRAFFPITVS